MCDASKTQFSHVVITTIDLQIKECSGVSSGAREIRETKETSVSHHWLGHY